MPIERKSDLPGTIQRSSAKAQRTFTKTYNAALDTYDGDESRASRAAYASLKHSFHKVGDRWQAKRRPGPSDPRARSGGPDPSGESAGGVDVEGSTKEELYERARKLDVPGRSRMTKLELGQAIAQRQD